MANPDVVDISDAKPEKLIIAGKKPGQTELFIWGDDGKREFLVRVASENLDTVKTRVQEVLGKAQIKGISMEESPYEGKVVLYGSLPKTDKDTFDKIMDPYADRIINLVKLEASEDLVQIDMQVVELSTTLSEQLGFDWNTSSGSSSSSSSSGTSGTGSSSSGSSSSLSPSYQEKTEMDKGSNRIFNLNSFSRTTPILVTVNALVKEGKGKVLSNPRLVVMSGKEASFLVGGEIPIKTTTTSASGGSQQENVTFKPYGVNMTITPTIRQGKVDILLNINISDIDGSTKTSNGEVAFTTRTAQTQLFLDNKQTIVLAGFIKHSESATVKGIPFLSKMPLVGLLFRSQDKEVPTQTEMVISLTPTILRSKKTSTEQLSWPSQRIEDFTKEIQSRFAKESLDDAQPPKEQAQAATPVVEKKEIKPAPVKVTDAAVLSYVRWVQDRISGVITYPYEAIQNNWQGTVKLRLRIQRDGSLADCDILQSSGHDVFDADALHTAKTLAPYSAFPQGMTQQDLVVTIPIVYNQKTKIKKAAQPAAGSY